MPDDPLHQPHDKLFKAGFGDPANAAAFLREEFPATVSEKIAWDRLRPEPGTFVDSHYRHSESDLLFSAPLGQSDCLIYLLFEHQTAEDPALALRLLRYMVRIWENRLKAEPGSPLPVILPVVLAQNAEVWNLRPHFAALLDIPSELENDLRPFVPDFRFRLIQLAALPFEAIRGTPSGIMILRTMKAERAARLLDDPMWDEALLVRLPREIWELLIRYMLGSDIDKQAFDAKVHAIRRAELRDSTMTLAEQYIEEGLQKGLQKAIIDTLEIRFGDVSAGLKEAVAAQSDGERLSVLHRAAVQAESLEVFVRRL